VVIPTLGRPIIEKCLTSIGQGSLLPGEVIVVDQGNNTSIDVLLAELAASGSTTRRLPMKGRGRAAALNLGLEAVATPFVLITDDDCEVDRDWLRIMAEQLRRHPQAAVTGAVLSGGNEPILNTVRDLQPSVARRPSFTYDRLSGGNCGIPREVFRQVGLFDDDPCMRFAEDGEWAYRALRNGVAIAYEPGARVTHLGWRAAAERVEQYQGYARTHAAFFGKYLRRGDLFIAARALVHIGRAALRWLRGALRGDAELAANGRAYVTEFLPGIADGLRSRARPPALQ
jgi:GT2 family glycosyltransferase